MIIKTWYKIKSIAVAMLTRPLQQASGQRVMAYRTINVQITECAARNSKIHPLKMRPFDGLAFSLCACVPKRDRQARVVNIK